MLPVEQSVLRHQCGVSVQFPCTGGGSSLAASYLSHRLTFLTVTAPLHGHTVAASHSVTTVAVPDTSPHCTVFCVTAQSCHTFLE